METWLPEPKIELWFDSSKDILVERIIELSSLSTPEHQVKFAPALRYDPIGGCLIPLDGSESR